MQSTGQEERRETRTEREDGGGVEIKGTLHDWWCGANERATQTFCWLMSSPAIVPLAPLYLPPQLYWPYVITFDSRLEITLSTVLIHVFVISDTCRRTACLCNSC